MFVRLTSSVCIIFALILSIVYVNDAFDIEKDLVFRLYTREEPVMYYALNGNGSPPIPETTFKPNRPTRIFVHGFRSKGKVIIRYKDAYLGVGDYNFIAIDWIKGASTYNYYSAKGRVQAVSYCFKRFILNGSRIILIECVWFLYFI